MAKTMRNVVITAIVMILVAAGLSAVVMSGGCSKMASDPVEGARINALNAIVESSGIKETLDSRLREEGRQLAAYYGVSPDVVDNVVDSAAIKDWKVTTLPENAIEESSYTIDVDGQSVEITTYDDDSVVTVGAYGQEVTFEVPESARDYLPYAEYLQYLQ